ncbi:hypothetical protein V5799_020677, partial [Amblyomma americanum]
SGKVIPCRYLCIKINFFELPSIILGTEKDGVLCSTLLLRRRGVCKNGGCIPFGTEEEIKPKGTFGKVILAIDKFTSGSFRKKAPEPGTPFGPIVTTATSIIGGGSGPTAEGTSETASNPIASAAAGVLAGKVSSAFKKLLSGKLPGDRKSESPGTGSASDNPDQIPNENPATSSGRAEAFDSPPVVAPPTSNSPEQQPNENSATNSDRAVALDFPPTVPPSTKDSEISEGAVFGTPRRSSPSGGMPRRRLFDVFGSTLNKMRRRSQDNRGETLSSDSAPQNSRPPAGESGTQGNGNAGALTVGYSQNSKADGNSSFRSNTAAGDAIDEAGVAGSTASGADSFRSSSNENRPSQGAEPSRGSPSGRRSPSVSLNGGTGSGDTESPRSNAGGSESSSSSVHTPVPTHNSTYTNETPSEPPTSPSAGASLFRGNSKPVDSGTMSQETGASVDSESRHRPRNSETGEPPEGRNGRETGSSSYEPPKRRSFFGSLTSSARTGAASATRNIFSRFRRSYTV